jgi:hypothetical protein
LPATRKRGTRLGRLAARDLLLSLLIGLLALEPPCRRLGLLEQRRWRHALDIHLQDSLFWRLWYILNGRSVGDRSRFGDDRRLGVLRAHTLRQLARRTFSVALLRLFARHSLLGGALLGSDALLLVFALALGVVGRHFRAHLGRNASRLALLLLATRALRIEARLLRVALRGLALGALLLLRRHHAGLLCHHGGIETCELGRATLLCRLSLLLRLGRRRRRRRLRGGGGETARHFGTARFVGARLLGTTSIFGGNTCRSDALLLGDLDTQRSRLVGGALLVGDTTRFGRLLRLGDAACVFGTLGISDALGLFGTLRLFGALLVGNALGLGGLLCVVGALGIGTLRRSETLGLVLFRTTLILETTSLLGASSLLGESRGIGARLLGELARGLETSMTCLTTSLFISGLLESNSFVSLIHTQLLGDTGVLGGTERDTTPLIVGTAARLTLFNESTMSLGSSSLFNKCTFTSQCTLSTALLFTTGALVFGGLAISSGGTQYAQSKCTYIMKE